MQFFDTHAHLGLIHPDPIEQLLVCQQAKQAGVTKIVCICNSLLDFKQTYENLKSVDFVYHGVGVAPSEVKNPGRDWMGIVESATKLPRVIAIGEIGLDYHHRFGDRNSQIKLFIEQLELASRLGLPAIIHNRDSGKDIFDILRDTLSPAGGVLHCYSEDAGYAERILGLNLNLYFSFAGNLTFRNARNLHDTVGVIPLDRILIESVAPFMEPAEFRGKRNMPEYLPHTAYALAQLLEKDIEEVADALYKNSCRFFNLEMA